MKKQIIKQTMLFCVAGLVAISAYAQHNDTSQNQSSEEQIESILSRLTLEEKIAMTHAQSKFSSPGVKRLGIPEFWTTDGPHGVRPEVLWDEWDGPMTLV